MKSTLKNLLIFSTVIFMSCTKHKVNDLYEPRSVYPIARMGGMSVEVSSTRERPHILGGFEYRMNSKLDISRILLDTNSQEWFVKVNDLFAEGDGTIIILSKNHSYECCDGIQESTRFLIIDFKAAKILEIDQYPTTNYFYGDIIHVDSNAIYSKGYHAYSRNQVDYHKVLLIENSEYDFKTINTKILKGVNK